ncbi:MULTISPECIES: type VII secretion protein EccB [Saccharothrix]|uniref:type VII secretion protein EccB n=1 Tax=Saccharothrix TaxID=2071 RepID=UPI00093B0E68|nr:type VII secretion protein EccB [Saccharothrix sp. CB00851]OKI13875.1 type VII secretion protein EccB [Saccharothrix sp. CB00851]
MASNRDQLQAQQFLLQRVVSALVTGETDPEQPPFRRSVVAAFGGIAIAVVVLAGFGVYGMVSPGGSTAWRGEVVVVEEETGARHVYLDGRLHPVANYVSALLALGKHAPTRTVSRESLAGVPRGPRIGIEDAPDSLPDPDRLLTTGWTMCSQPRPDVTGATVNDSVLVVGGGVPGGRSLDDRALLVDVPDTGDQYLLWRGFRHRIKQADTVAVGLALRSEPRARVGSSMVDVLPAGEPIAPIALPDIGAESKAVPGARIGRLFAVETSGGAVQHYLAEAEVLRPISELQYDIQRAFQPTAQAYDGGQPFGLPLGLVVAGQARQGPPVAIGPGKPPTARPEFAAADGSVLCAAFDGAGSPPTLVADPDLPAPDPLTTATARRTETGTPLADRVIVPPGRAAVVEVMPGPDAPVGTVVLVTDQGRAHPLAQREVLEVLGYKGFTPVRLPVSLVARVPHGSPLDPVTALARV